MQRENARLRVIAKDKYLKVDQDGLRDHRLEKPETKPYEMEFVVKQG